MSSQTVLEFLKTVAADASLQQKLGDDPTVERLVSVAKSLGFEISAEEFAAAQRAGSSPVELTHADLDQVAGAGFLSIFCRKKPTGGDQPTEQPTEPDEPERDTRSTAERLDEIINKDRPIAKGPLDSQTPLLCPVT